MNRIRIITFAPHPSREERFASTARYEAAMACLWGASCAFCGIWSYALSMGGFSPISLPLGIASATMGILAIGSVRNALHQRHLLGQHRAFLSNMKPTNRL